MKTIYKTLLSLLLLCLLGTAGKGYGQEVKPGTVLWEFQTGDVCSSPAIGSDGTIYVASALDGNLYAVNPDGSKKWVFKTNSWLLSYPAIGSDGTIYVGAFDRNLYAINPDGSKKWAFNTSGHLRCSPAIGSDGTIYVGSDDRNLYAVNPDGSKKWAFETSRSLRTFPAIGSDGTIYVASALDGNLYAVNPDGSKKWVFKLQNGSSLNSYLAFGDDGVIYVGSNDQKFWAINPDGTVKWSFEKQPSSGFNFPAIGSDGAIYVGSNDQKLWAINPDGTMKWTFRTGNEGHSFPAIGSDGTIYLSNDPSLYAINPDGTKKWELKIDGENSSPAIGSDGTIYISNGRKLYAIKTSCSGLADSHWPMIGRNSFRTSVQPSGPIVFAKQPATTSIGNGDSVYFDIKIKGAFPRTYQWQRNGVDIPGATQASLTIENATSKDSGLYRVTITNKHGSVTSDEAVLKVVSPGTPQIFADGKEVVGSVVKGDKAEITLSTSFESGSIFYTLDGSEPSFESPLYDAPFTVNKTTGIRAVAYKEDFSDLVEADPVFINIVPNYKLIISVQGQGTVVKPPGPYMQDSVVKLKAVPEVGWRFSGWSGALKSSFEEGSVVMGSDKDITAVFEEIPKFKLKTGNSFGGFITGIDGIYDNVVNNGKQIVLAKGDSYIFKFNTSLDAKPFKGGYYNAIEFWHSNSSEKRLEYFEINIGNEFINAESLSGSDKVMYDIGLNPWQSGIGEMEIKYKGSSLGKNDESIKINKIKVTLLFSNNEIYQITKDNFDVSFFRNEKINLIASPWDDFIFLGWEGDAESNDPNLTLTMDRDKLVEAIFGTELKTTATGRGKLIINPPSGPYPYGSKVNITPVPDAGYYLGVWGGNAAGLPKGPIEYEITEANPKITALFVPLKENRFTVTTLASLGGSVVSNPNSNAYVNGQAVTLTATPDPGYSFVGWIGDIASTANPLVTLADANKTVTAEFRRNIIAPVTLTINAENGTVTRSPSDELYEKGTSVELLAQPNAGYTFTGWAGALGGTASRTILFLDGDKTVTANFKASYQLAAETRGPGSVLTTPSSTTFIDGDEVILTASPAEGYGFVGWTGDLESTDQQTTLAIDSNKRVIAHFAQLGTLTTWTRGEGTITRSPDKESYFPGAKVTLTAKPGDGFQFVSWDGQASGTSNPTTVTMDRAMSVAANFKDIKAPTVTIASPPAQETGDETFTLSGTATDNGKIKSLVWLWKGQEMGELELVDGKFELPDQKLAGGANAITVVATDRSGNEGKATVSPTWVADRSIRIAAAKEQQEGNRIEVPIEISSKGNVGGMGFVLNYDHSYLMDPVLTWSSAAGGSINLVNSEVSGELKGTFSLGGTSLPGGDQLIGTVSFRARSVPQNVETAIGLQEVSVSDKTGNIFDSGTDVVSGDARVLVRDITGDNNANDRLDVGDATRIQRLWVGLDRARAWDVSGNDLNGNGVLDPGDVTKVLRTVVGIDPQPNRNRVIAKMGGDDEAVETAMLLIKEKTASTVTVQVQLKDMASTIAGANFQLEYPTELLRLKDKSSHAPGEIVAANAAAIWNVSPAQTDYAKQDGTLAMAVSSPEPWTVKDGVLAEISFEVQNGADLNNAVLALSQVEVTPDGFDNRMLSGSSFNVGSGETDKPTEPNEVEIIGIENAPFGFSFNTEEGTRYEVQASDDLRKWEQLREVKGTGEAVKFVDFRKAIYEQQYYRVRVVE